MTQQLNPLRRMRKKIRKERLNICSCIALLALNQHRPIGEWAAQVIGICTRAAMLCAFLKTLRIWEEPIQHKKKEMWKISEKSKRKNKKKKKEGGGRARKEPGACREHLKSWQWAQPRAQWREKQMEGILGCWHSHSSTRCLQLHPEG